MESTIVVKVTLDNEKVPQKIEWTAEGTTAEKLQEAKATMIAFWDSQETTALRIDLWTKEMMVDEMVDFYYQTFIGMSNSLENSTKLTSMSNDLRAFAKAFLANFRKDQEGLNKPQ